MILRPRLRPAGFSSQSFPFKQRQYLSPSSSPSSSPSLRRTLIIVPQLGNNNERANFFAEHGVPGFLTAKTFNQTWTKYQNHLTSVLNQNVEGTEWADKSAWQLHVEWSRRPENTDLYNYAAMSWHNYKFWDGISPEEKGVPDGLLKDIEEHFGSLAALRQEMLEHANSLFGNGFVWLVRDVGPSFDGRELRLLCTYNAGSPYAEAYHMRQTAHLASLDSKMTRPQNNVGSAGPYSASRDTGIPTSQLKNHPLICLNVWQHMWIPDYGITGKPVYLSAWWDRIDWDQVETRRQMAKQSSSRDQRFNGT